MVVVLANVQVTNKDKDLKTEKIENTFAMQCFFKPLVLVCLLRCLLKWLEIRSVCPMCNKPILRLHTDAPQGAEGPMDPEEV